MTAFIVITALMALLCGGILAITPWIMPPTECFAVTVPPSAQEDPRIKRFRETYSAVVIATSVVGALGVGTFMLTRGAGGEGDSLVDTVLCIATLLPLVVGFVLMLFFRSRVRQLKEQEGWKATGNKSVALVDEDEVPQPISLAWDLLYVVLAAATAAFALFNYDLFPSRIPMRASFSGTVVMWANKSVGTVLFPAFMVAFMGLVFTLGHWGILQSKRPVDPAAPSTSALAYGIFARTQSIVMLVGGLSLSLAISVFFNLTSLGIVSMGAATIALLAFSGAFVGVVAWLTIAQGQSGARIAADLRTSDELARDDDAYWVLGAFYCNGEDASIFVPKRFGVGWTINVAQPAGWVFFGLILLVTLGFAWVTTIWVA